MPKTDKTKYLIIGNSAGGIGAAEAIRELDKTGAITIVSDEPYHVYSRPEIAHHLAEGRPLERMLYRKLDFYEQNRISARLGVKVAKLEPDAHTVELEDGDKIQYEKLLLATGGTPIVPPMDGLKREETFTFTTMDDAERIDAFLKSHADRQVDALVIGGGLIGISASEALVARGVKVTIVEMRDRVLNVLLDEAGSAIGAEALKEAGIDVITEHTVEKVTTDAAGNVTEVTLDDGSPISCDMVIVAIGVAPRRELAAGTDISVNRGVLVNQYMATSEADIYACGDVAEAYDFIYGENRLSPIWPNAYLGGRIAGLNMAGKSVKYPGGTAMNSTKYFGLAISSAGLVMPPDDSYEVITSTTDHNYKKVVIKDGVVVGLLFSGDIEKSGIIFSLMKDKIDVSGFKEELVADDFGLISMPEKIWKSRLERPVSPEMAPAEEAEKDLAVMD